VSVAHFERNMTRRFLSLFVLALTGWLATPYTRGADPTNPAPDFKEVYELLRANLPGATDGILNHAAIEGMLSRLAARRTGNRPRPAEQRPWANTPSSKIMLRMCASAGLQETSLVNWAPPAGR
jgi:hypothetical protein